MNKYSVISSFILFSVLLSGCQTNSETVDIESSFTTATPAVTVTPAATVEPSPTAIEQVLTLDQKIDAFMNGSAEFPSNLSPEEYKAFIEGMNERRGGQPIWVEGTDQGGAPVVVYFDVAKGKMVELKGTYADNKAVIEQNTWNQYVEFSSDAEGNLQYVNPDTGELVSVPGSAGMDWNMVIDETNFDSAPIDWPSGENKYGFPAKLQYEFFISGSATLNEEEHKLENM